ncbi:hypothetical protein GGF46_003015 [Coemansia sp. RSA 552]|nr:hypothetical protein GGF46_003015 [Coemansia sp. RSA 552]
MDGFDVENSPLVNLLDTVLTEYNTHLRALLGSLDTEGNLLCHRNRLIRFWAKKTAKDKEVEEDVDEGGFAHMEEDQFDDVDADDLLLSLDLNPDLD